jgi:hypothetical protein
MLAETASSLQVLDMPLVEIDDEDMRVLFNLATRYHTSHLRVHVYLAILNLLAETASSLQVLDMPLVEIDDEDMRVFVQPSYALPHFTFASPCIFSYI